MNNIKKIPVNTSDEKVYIFEFVEKSQKGLFASGVTEVGADETVLVQLVDLNNNIKLELSGQIAWVNSSNEPGVGVVFPTMSMEQFQLGTSLIPRVAYI